MAALDFPNSPSNGDTYSANGLTYTYNSSSTKWVRTSPSVGAQGAQGHQGHQGAAGAQGAQGATAAAGAQGNQGHQGDDGAGGSAGAQGNQGHQGAAGAQGAQGHQGHQGAGGSAGAQGNQGHQGAGGTAGAQGHQGSAGSATISGNADNRVITGGSGTNLVGESGLTYNGSRLTVDGDLLVEGQSNLSGEIRLVHDAGNQNHDYWKFESNKDTHALNIQGYGTGSYVDALTISQNTNSVGVVTGEIDKPNLSNPVGAGHSLVGLYIGDGSLMFSSALSRSGGYYISTDINALNAGPVTLNSNMKLDGTWVIV